MPTLLALPDKFRGTATAAQVGAAMAAAADDAGWRCSVASGVRRRRGTRSSASAAPNRVTSGHRAARRAGDRGLAPGRRARRDRDGRGLRPRARRRPQRPARRDDARHRGTRSRPRSRPARGEIVVGVGGSATTDGGLGAVEVLAAHRPLIAGHRRRGRDDGLRRRRPTVRAAEGRRRRRGRTSSPTAFERLARRATGTATASTSRRCPGRAPPAAWPAGWPRSARAIRPGFDVVAEQLDLAARIAERGPGAHRRGSPRRDQPARARRRSRSLGSA